MRRQPERWRKLASASLRISLLAVALLLGCDRAEPPGPVPAAKTAEPCLCFDGIGSSKGDPPILELVVEGEPRLIACGYAEEPAEGGTATMSEFDVFDCASGESLLRYSADDVCEVAVRGDELHIAELGRLPVGEYWEWRQVPITRRKISAAGPSLEVGEPQTVLELPSLNQERVDAFVSELSAMKAPQLRRVEEWEQIFGKLLVCAAAGDGSCIAVLEDPETQLKVDLDGAVAELHQKTFDLFKAIGVR